MAEVKRRFHNLRELREAYGMSLLDVGNKLGLTAPTIWQWEQKPNEWIRPKHRRLLEQVFTREDIAETFDADWTPPEPEKEPEPPKPKRTYLADTEYSESEMEHMIRELLSVFLELKDDSKVSLVDYADYLYQRETGMKLPRITKAAASVPESTWDTLDELRQLPSD